MGNDKFPLAAEKRSDAGTKVASSYKFFGNIGMGRKADISVDAYGKKCSAPAHYMDEERMLSSDW
ncbi:hypothetical protein MASR2M78_04790 [Treponema sp.]